MRRGRQTTAAAGRKLQPEPAPLSRGVSSLPSSDPSSPRQTSAPFASSCKDRFEPGPVQPLAQEHAECAEAVKRRRLLVANFNRNLPIGREGFPHSLYPLLPLRVRPPRPLRPPVKTGSSPVRSNPWHRSTRSAQRPDAEAVKRRQPPFGARGSEGGSQTRPTRCQRARDARRFASSARPTRSSSPRRSASKFAARSHGLSATKRRSPSASPASLATRSSSSPRG